MKIKEYLERIIEKGDRKDMEELSDMLDKAIYKVKDCDPEWYDKKCMKLYTMAYGKVLNEEMAKNIISKMEPYHMHWTLEQTRQVQVQNGLNNIRDIDFWVVMNSAYNDFQDLFEDNIDMYVKYTKNFILDKDGKEDKVFLYYTTTPK
jgi:hypothetical protein